MARVEERVRFAHKARLLPQVGPMSRHMRSHQKIIRHVSGLLVEAAIAIRRPAPARAVRCRGASSWESVW